MRGIVRSLSKETAQARPTGDKRRLEQASVAEREEPIIAKDHVVQHANAEHVSGFFESPRDFLVFLTGRRIAARVVVNEHDGRRAQVKRRAPHFRGWTSDAVRLPVETTLKPLTRFLLFMASNRKCSVRVKSLIDRAGDPFDILRRSAGRTGGKRRRLCYELHA